MTTATAAKKSSSLPTTSCNHHAIQKPTCAGEAFVESFANVTRSMLAQSKALARTVSLAQVLDTSFDKENVPGDDMNVSCRVQIFPSIVYRSGFGGSVCL